MESLRQLYKIGRGPSSSHTMGPELASKLFLGENGNADEFRINLYGSLALTGKGHLTDAIIKEVFHDYSVTVKFNTRQEDLPHANTMDLLAFRNGTVSGFWRVSSVGGGSIKIYEPDKASPDYPTLLSLAASGFVGTDKLILRDSGAPEEIYPLNSFKEIKQYCRDNDMRLWQYVKMVEGDDFFDYLEDIWRTMKQAISTGLQAEGEIGGGLHLNRVAKRLYTQHHIDESAMTRENRTVCSYAYAVSEQNATLGTIVTAPTCGSCGVVPAVMRYLQERREFSDREILRALATGGLIGNLVKKNASISGAECGCQAEIGTACSMAAAAAAEAYGMDLDQIEYAAEIAMEHHLGLTCDPVNGLVQIPCIERNAVAAMRAINAVRLANFLASSRKISFDMVVETMRRTGIDIASRYRETSEGGLAEIYTESKMWDSAEKKVKKAEGNDKKNS